MSLGAALDRDRILLHLAVRVQSGADLEFHS